MSKDVFKLPEYHPEYDPAKKRLAKNLGQLARYMDDTQMRFGVYTNYLHTIFVYRSADTEFRVSPPIPYKSQQPSLRECFIAVADLIGSSDTRRRYPKVVGVGLTTPSSEQSEQSLQGQPSDASLGPTTHPVPEADSSSPYPSNTTKRDGANESGAVRDPETPFLKNSHFNWRVFSPPNSNPPKTPPADSRYPSSSIDSAWPSIFSTLGHSPISPASSASQTEWISKFPIKLDVILNDIAVCLAVDRMLSKVGSRSKVCKGRLGEADIVVKFHPGDEEERCRHEYDALRLVKDFAAFPRVPRHGEALGHSIVVIEYIPHPTLLDLLCDKSTATLIRSTNHTERIKMGILVALLDLWSKGYEHSDLAWIPGRFG